MAPRRAHRYLLLSLLVAVALFVPSIVTTAYPVAGNLVVVAHPSSHLYTFPNGGRRLFPAYRLVALYGTPNAPELGALGEQTAEAAAERVKALADSYRPLTTEHVLPTFEIITTVASATPTEDGDYSYPVNLDTLRQWVLAARGHGVYVVLDLQPGRSDFLTQARQYEDLLAQPNVGLALDPEWRLKPNQVPLEQIGSVEVHEVNAVVDWLARLTHDHHLPQKLLLLHQFRVDMLPQREQLDTSSPDLAFAVQMDGQGAQDAKIDTYHAITANPPANVHFGWKNFYQKDEPTRSPQDTMQLNPQPWYISYQ